MENNNIDAFTSPCVIERSLDQSTQSDFGAHYILRPQASAATYELLRVDFSLAKGDSRTNAPDRVTLLDHNLSPERAITTLYKVLGNTFEAAHKRTDARLQCWLARTPQAMADIRPVSTFGNSHPDQATLSQKYASHWGQKIAPFRGNPRMGHPGLDFLFK